MRFAKVYIDTVLAENFEDAKRLFFQSLLDIHYAHLIMLVETEILFKEDAEILVQALNEISQKKIEPVAYDSTFEDLFFYIEHLLEESCGSKIAGKLHTARSRNDVDVTLYRLRWREFMAQIMRSVLELRKTLVRVCSAELRTLIPVYTHTQPAQPSSVAHYFMSFVEHLERDHARLRASLETMNRCPLGSCAVTGTGFPIDRQLVSDLLAFDEPMGNTYGGIACTDYLLEGAGSLMTLLTDLGRLIQDLLQWCMPAFNFLQLADGCVQPSSIMPQKRNPVALEHARSLASLALGQFSALFQALHNTPFGDIVDVEDDLQPLVFRAFRDSSRSIELLAEVLATARFNREQMLTEAGRHWTTFTELADELVRREQVSFRSAHRIASQMVRRLRARSDLSLSEALREVSQEELDRSLEYDEKILREWVSPQNFVEVRKHLGGPSAPTLEKAVRKAREALKDDAIWMESIEQRFSNFRPQLQTRAREISNAH